MIHLWEVVSFEVGFQGLGQFHRACIDPQLLNDLLALVIVVSTRDSWFEWFDGNTKLIASHLLTLALIQPIHFAVVQVLPVDIIP